VVARRSLRALRGALAALVTLPVPIATTVSDLTELEQLWREQGIDEETCVFSALLYLHNVAPEQVLLDAGCKGFQDDHAPHALAESATRLMDDNCDASDVED
jgi:hypothetical protein